MIGTDVYLCWRKLCSGKTFPLDQYLPTGLGGVDGHPQAGLYRMRRGGGYQDGVAQASEWVPVKIVLMLDPADPATVRHKWEPGLKPVGVAAEGDPVDPIRVWDRCLRRTADGKGAIPNVIDKSTYDFWLAHKRWPDDAPTAAPITAGASEPQAAEATGVTALPRDSAPAEPDDPIVGLGHNSGADSSSIAALIRELEMHDAATSEWLAKNPEGTPAGNKATKWKEELAAIESRVIEAYRVEKDPILEQAKAIDEKWRPLKTLADTLVKRMRGAIATIGAKEQARLNAIAQEEARKLQAQREAEHQERLRIEAQERATRIAAQAKAQAAGEVPAEPPAPEPPPPPPPAPVVAAPVKVMFQGNTRRAGIKTVPYAIITDWKAAAAHYAEALKVKAEVQKLADADAKKGIACPGSKLGERTAA